MAPVVTRPLPNLPPSSPLPSLSSPSPSSSSPSAAAQEFHTTGAPWPVSTHALSNGSSRVLPAMAPRRKNRASEEPSPDTAATGTDLHTGEFSKQFLLSSELRKELQVSRMNQPPTPADEGAQPGSGVFGQGPERLRRPNGAPHHPQKGDLLAAKEDWSFRVRRAVEFFEYAGENDEKLLGAWFQWLEKVFELKMTPEKEKVSFAAVFLKDMADEWFTQSFSLIQRVQLDWESFKDLLRERFFARREDKLELSGARQKKSLRSDVENPGTQSHACIGFSSEEKQDVKPEVKLDDRERQVLMLKLTEQQASAGRAEKLSPRTSQSFARVGSFAQESSNPGGDGKSFNVACSSWDLLEVQVQDGGSELVWPEFLRPENAGFRRLCWDRGKLRFLIFGMGKKLQGVTLGGMEPKLEALLVKSMEESFREALKKLVVMGYNPEEVCEAMMSWSSGLMIRDHQQEVVVPEVRSRSARLISMRWKTQAEMKSGAQEKALFEEEVSSMRRACEEEKWAMEVFGADAPIRAELGREAQLNGDLSWDFTSFCTLAGSTGAGEELERRTKFKRPEE